MSIIWKNFPNICIIANMFSSFIRPHALHYGNGLAIW